ncbi:ARPP-1 family domain-containing protein [Thermogemmatispora sp.]|uniref:ARPP-1 family domain-containing protein n=1 Tax=Thermogemmatispora sp. TaxID=1968838 RepID=UPI0035E43C68
MMEIQVKQEVSETSPLTGLLAHLAPGPLVSWGLLEVVGLFPVSTELERSRARFLPPMRSLEVVGSPSYGTLVLRNQAEDGVLVLPMHIAFFQPGVQNHATSRVLVLDAGETLTVDDCFCIQQRQGGTPRQAQQRFCMLPLGLRRAALELQGVRDFSRLWTAITAYSRRYGIDYSGHLERWLRPNFARLLPYRHALEWLPGQVGAAFFLAGKLVGLEVAPNSAYWQELLPVLLIYCYGPAALLAERQQRTASRPTFELEGLRDLDDLQQRLYEARRQERRLHLEQICSVATLHKQARSQEEHAGLRVLSINHGEWLGQAVCSGSEVVYLSLFRSEL